MRSKTIAKIAATAAAGFLAVVGLVGCGGSAQESDDANPSSAETIRVGASPTPHGEILASVADDLAEKGYTLEVVEYSDYITPNLALDSGELDANYFQHTTYLADYNETNGTDLAEAAQIHFEPMALYPGKTGSLDLLSEGATIAVPNDVTNEARALKLLADTGLIELPDNADFTVRVVDVKDNPKKLKIKEIEATQIPRMLADVDMACINGNYALMGGLTTSSAIIVESNSSDMAKKYANVVAVRDSEKDSAKTKALVEALTSEKVKKMMEETYGSAVVPMF